MRFFFCIFTFGVLAEDKSETISRWASDLQVEYKVLTNIDKTDRGFKYQGKESSEGQDFQVITDIFSYVFDCGRID